MFLGKISFYLTDKSGRLTLDRNSGFKDATFAGHTLWSWLEVSPNRWRHFNGSCPLGIRQESGNIRSSDCTIRRETISFSLNNSIMNTYSSFVELLIHIYTKKLWLEILHGKDLFVPFIRFILEMYKCLNNHIFYYRIYLDSRCISFQLLLKFGCACWKPHTGTSEGDANKSKLIF